MTPENQSPAESIPEPELLVLARKHFGRLSRAEAELFRATWEGRPVLQFTGDEKEDDLANAGNWDADRAVRAQCISWVCTNPQASVLVTHRGLQLYGMRIDGELDLGHAQIKFPLRAGKCAFPENISLQDAQLMGFYLVGCHIKSLNAARAIIKSSVFLRTGFRAEGEVNLDATKIGGDLDCDGAQFLNANGFALRADGAQIEKRVFLRTSEAESQVNLRGIRIGGNLECDRSRFSNAKGVALNINTAKIGGNVFLRNGFKVEGEVTLAGAIIGGGLECASSRFLNANGTALNVNAAKIEGSIFLRDGFEAEGEVNLVAATIGGVLDCDGAHAKGEVNLAGATIAGSLLCGGPQFLNAKGVALSAEGAKIGGNVVLWNGFKAEGKVSLVGTTIGGGLQIRNIMEADKLILDLGLTKVETFWDDEESWPKAGNLFLDGFRYERLYERAPFQADSRKKWLSLQPQDKYRPQPYEQLAAVLRRMGHERDARLVMVEKNRERASHTHFPHQSWWWYNLFGKFIGYGYRPWRAFAMSLAMILFGTILFQIGSVHGLISPTGENAYVKEPNSQALKENKPSKISEKYPVFNAFFYSLESFTPLLKLDQSAHWAPNANRHAEVSAFCCKAPFTGRLLRYYLYFHIAAGWLLTSLWVGAITGLVKT